MLTISKMTLPLALIAVLAVNASADSFGIGPNPGFPPAPTAQLAQRVVNGTERVINASYQMSDYGQAVNELVNFNRAAQQFAYTLNYNDFQRLRYAYDQSRTTWQYLRAYQYEHQTLSWIDNDMQELIYQSNGPGPGPIVQPPQHGSQLIWVTGQGSGGTKLGHKDQACSRSQERATQAAINSCQSQNGSVQQTNVGGCSCKKISSQEYNCRSQTQVKCLVYY